MFSIGWASSWQQTFDANASKSRAFLTSVVSETKRSLNGVVGQQKWDSDEKGPVSQVPRALRLFGVEDRGASGYEPLVGFRV